MASVTNLNIYPVKGVSAVPQEAFLVQSRGLEHDRRYLIVDAENTPVTQRQLSILATMTAQVKQAGLTLGLGGMESLAIDVPHANAPRRIVSVWYNETDAVDCGDEAAAWLSQALGEQVRLTYMDKRASRQAYKESNPGDEVSFADTYPVMVANEASLADLNAKLESPVPMNRFRPNIVVKGFEAWDEDNWTSLVIGGVRFRAVADCGRCLVTTIDQATGEKTGSEPLRTLATFRTIDQKVVFGRYLIPETYGEIRVGDEVTATSPRVNA